MSTLSGQPSSESAPAGWGAKLRRVRVSARRGMLARMRIRKKLMVIHTVFSLVLAAILLVSLRPAIGEVVRRAERNEAKLVLEALIAGTPQDRLPAQVSVRTGSASALGVDAETAARAAANPGTPVDARGGTGAVAFSPAAPGGGYMTAEATIPEARAAVVRLYLLMTVALLGVYALVALALEVFVLPQHVYGPIRRMLRADEAVQEGRAQESIIEESEIPADELGEIMRSRNEAILLLRKHQSDLAAALARLEEVASDLKRKNHILEATQRILADTDRLASLGMMSAGIAHELNTPLAVLKGLVEQIHANPAGAVDPARAALMLRVVRRLERLGEGLLDFARVRPPHSRPTSLHTIIDEAAMLVRLDREAGEIPILLRVEPDLVIECDADRMVQVFVNLLRNAVDAVRRRRAVEACEETVWIEARPTERDGVQPWVSVTVTDTGPGIEPEMLERIFDPFVTTTLDARGTGLGLAVAEGIIKEHAGVLLARNRPARAGAVFEILLPVRPPPGDAASAGAV